MEKYKYFSHEKKKKKKSSSFSEIKAPRYNKKTFFSSLHDLLGNDQVGKMVGVIQRKLNNGKQLKENSSDIVQRKIDLVKQRISYSNKDNSFKTALPFNIKSRFESFSGIDLSGVKVHKNSPKPLNVNAHAYTQGSNIYVAPGQEKYLAHEAWHVVQQKQGRVKATGSVGGMALNDSAKLEREADLMGRNIAGSGLPLPVDKFSKQIQPGTAYPIQRARTQTQNKKGSSSKPTPRVSRNPKSRKLEKFLTKLRESRIRNMKVKAYPKHSRHIFKYQQKSNYGFPGSDVFKFESGSTGRGMSVVPFDPSLNPEIKPQYSQIQMGDTGGYYRSGWGGQPFFYLDKSKFTDSMIPSDYDEIIKYFSGKDAEEAIQILNIIYSGEKTGTDKLGQARALFVYLTQFIEAHNSRISGADKLARALLRRISSGQLTFYQCFNRQNGLFVSAWAKKAKAPVGGQEAARALFGVETGKSQNFTIDDLEEYWDDKLIDELILTIDGYYSDSSDDESDIEDEQLGSIDFKVVRKEFLDQINGALLALNLKGINSLDKLICLMENFIVIKKSYHKMVLHYHPDKNHDPGAFDIYQNANRAYKFLCAIISKFKKSGGLDLSKMALLHHLGQEGLQIVPVEGNGNCFYSAVLQQLNIMNGIVADSNLLRGRIVQLILDNQDHFRMYAVGQNIEVIVNDILNNFSWNNQGGDFAPQLVATVLQRDVRIISPANVQTFNPIAGLVLNPGNTYPVPGAPLVLAYNGINHYDGTQQQMLQ